MMDTKSILVKKLQLSGINDEEAILYAELVKEPNTHLQLSRKTGINRTKVYRLVSQLEKRGLVTRKSDGTGTFLTAGDPTVLETAIITQEDSILRQKQAIQELGTLVEMVRGTQESSAFAVYTYEGYEGLKQMQWHELKTRGELFVLGNVTIEEIVGSRQWAERFREKVVEAHYEVREIINAPYDNPTFTKSDAYYKIYRSNTVSNSLLPISTPMVIYNDTVAIYQLDHGRKFGVEIVSKDYANTMRHIFEYYWQLD